MTNRKTSCFALIFALIFTAGCTSQKETTPQKEYLYVGTYSVRGSEGIYSFQFDRKNLQFKLVGTSETLMNPNFLEINEKGEHLYSVNGGSLPTYEEYGSLSAFEIDKETGSLSKLNETSSYGKGPCHISLSQDQKSLYISHYSGGSLAVFDVKENGRIGMLTDSLTHTGSSVNPSRQEKPHVHSILPISGTDYFIAADLGTDKLNIYKLLDGQITPAGITFIQTEGGAGPRHFDFLPNSPFIYVGEEMTSTISVHFLDLEKGETHQIQRISTLPEDFSENNSVADIHISPDGKFLYVSNRGYDGLGIFSVDKASGKLTTIGHQKTGGKKPRNFLIDKKGEFVLAAHQDTDNI
ncbi:MAG: lactonase family protein, partial [Bacteroidetes bacterium]|nr:lactonase family protein [Bacteroidota bacterium]